MTRSAAGIVQKMTTLRGVLAAWVAMLGLAVGVIAAPAVGQSGFPGLPGAGGKGQGDRSGAVDPLAGLGGLGVGAVEDREPVEVSAALVRRTVNPGAELAVALTFDILDGWKVWPGAGQDVLPASVDEFAIRTDAGIGAADPSAPPATFAMTDRPAWVFAVGGVQWPETGESVNPLGDPPMVEVIKGVSTGYIPLILAEDIAPGRYELPVTAFFQTCDDRTCLTPEARTMTVAFEVVAPGEAGTLPAQDAAEIAALFAGFDDSVFVELREGEAEIIEFDAFGLTITIDARGVVGISLLLAIAALGGALLNFTPCVLPVIPLKVMGLAKHAGDRKRTFFLGTVMSAGVVFFWLVLGGLIAFVSGFNAISALFQIPLFTLGVGVFIAAMAVGMLGVFTINLPQSVYMVNPSQESVPGSFLFGIMTAILSTPCTAPFMGAAAAWAAAQPNKTIVLATFMAIGLGMALPYFLLSANPQWVSKLPKAGEGAEVVKKTMGLLMLAVAAFFAGTGLSGVFTTAPDPPNTLYWWVVGGFVVAAGAYVIAKTVKLAKRRGPRVGFAALGVVLAFVGVAGAAQFTAKGPVDWVYYTPDRFAEAQAAGEVIVLDFTAEWCLNCKALEEAVLFRESVSTVLNGPGVTPIKIDLTGSNPDGQAKLEAMGRVAIPLLAVFEPGSATPVFLSDAYTTGQVLSAIEEAGLDAAKDAAGEVSGGAVEEPVKP